MGNEFERDLEAVFGERAADLKGETRRLLKQLWREGVKHGHHEERQSVANHGRATPRGMEPIRGMTNEGKVLIANTPGPSKWLDEATRFVEMRDLDMVPSEFVRRELFGKWED